MTTETESTMTTETETTTTEPAQAAARQRRQSVYERKLRLAYRLMRLFSDPACPLGLVQGLHDLMVRLVGDRDGGDD